MEQKLDNFKVRYLLSQGVKILLCFFIICQLQNAYCQQPNVIRGVKFVNANDLKAHGKDTLFNVDFLSNSSFWRKDTLLKSVELFMLNLFKKKIYINHDAVKLIQRLNPQISDTILYFLNTKLIFPEFPKEKRAEKRKNKLDLRLLNTPDSSLNSVFKNQIVTLNRKFSQISSKNLCIDSITNLIGDLNRFATRYYTTGSGNMKFITLMMDSLIEKLNSFYYSNYQLKSCSEIISIIQSIEDFIPSYAVTKNIPFETMGYSFHNNKNLKFINSIAEPECANNEEEKKPDSPNPKNSLSFHIIVYDSKKEFNAVNVFKDEGLSAQYTINYRSSKYYPYQTCGKKASIAYLNVPVSNYLISVSKDKHFYVTDFPYDLEKYMNENNWAKYDRLAIVIDINNK